MTYLATQLLTGGNHYRAEQSAPTILDFYVGNAWLCVYVFTPASCVTLPITNFTTLSRILSYLG